MQSRPNPKLAIIVPAYNEEAVIAETVSQLQKLLTSLSNKNLIHPDSYMYVVDDGSKDKTWEILSESAKKDRRVQGLSLSRNFGHQNALIAGMESVVDHCDVNVCIDADLQHDISLIESFLQKYAEGYEIVYGVKRERRSDSLFKRATAKAYYRILRWLGVNIVYNHADFRLLSDRVAKELLKFKERNLFLRGMIPILGFQSASLVYDVKERAAGKSKYSLRRMISLAIDGITSFSTVPLRVVAAIGLLATLLSLFETIVALQAYYQGITVPGWSSVVISIYFIGGVQLISLGVIGEYIGKIYSEVKGRPRYLVADRIS